jgi:hypothetical protein
MALALVSGTASAIACAATLTPSARGAFRLTPEVAALANEMFPWVLGATPFAMAFESAMGTVCGIGRVETATRWSAGKAAADAAATLAALGLGRGDAAKMRWIGVGTFAVSVAQAGLGWWLVSTTTPRGWDEPLAPRETVGRGGDVWIFGERREHGGAVDFVAELVLRRGGRRREELGAERIGGAPHRRVAVDGVLVRRRRIRDVRDGDRVAFVRRRSKG